MEATPRNKNCSFNGGQDHQKNIMNASRLWQAAFWAWVAAPLFTLAADEAATSAQFGFSRPIKPQFFPDDSRQWKGYHQSVMLTDLSRAEPASALHPGRREKGKWKVLPF